MDRTPSHEALCLTLRGIPTGTVDGEDIYFIHDPQGAWHPNKGNHLYEIDALCVNIHDAIASCVFGGLGNFHNFLYFAPEFLSSAGMNSESVVSKDTFSLFIEKLEGNIDVNKGLYLFDCRKIVSSIQECSKEVMHLQGEFYYTLNFEPLFFPNIKEDDGIRYVTSPVVTKLFALLGFIYIRMHSLLDYVTKLSIEIESLKTQFPSYAKLVSKKSQYSDRKKTTLNNHAGTLFEQCSLINEIESVRNHIIHDGLLDDMPKAYRVIMKNECVEKYLLFPDQTSEGRFESYKNRNLFYSRDNKINYRLPEITSQFHKRLLLTLGILLDKLNQKQN
ncbi:hypothetical protein AB6D34_03940 [Pectobacterium brasiliense]|uniref:Uncharacterized protein n=1 Tax=Pectobacterium brasiliense TaxID=180957 RepID=A0A3S0ZZ79_9GAMM|nr:MULTISPECIES: hypothetical protein [Pectobacterium]GKW26940.1 hypothetical protein PEC331060_01180 [Pectobacterium carotovorum subsp. carotovorum]MBN3047783.1 hypothetical protein [Pectobacterium brasiliense]MBN3076731.1 hypothetical protein [Pectobacterium brasiliense]MBN3084207.1 hypothetical protein [Pectobacterium brasiliense]MBN3088470.1 hypothetical protein [Pectobacterium brasiliense]